MIIATTKAELRQALAPHRAQGASIGLVPTMGYLHDGHLSLMRRSREENDVSVATIFVNPTQFGPNEDLDAYPRDPEGDAAKARSTGVDVLWVPEVPSVYEADHSTTVSVEGLTAHLCGASRPTHFAGVTTIVTKLFMLVLPTRAYFGQKDYQQLAVIQRMVRDLDMPIDVIGMPIVREPDGLAMSSRNQYLSADQRRVGLRLSQALRRAREAWATGERDADALRAALRASLADDESLRTDYAELVHPETLEPLQGTIDESGAVAALAAFVGATRLIDNARLDASGPL